MWIYLLAKSLYNITQNIVDLGTMISQYIYFLKNDTSIE